MSTTRNEGADIRPQSLSGEMAPSLTDDTETADSSFGSPEALDTMDDEDHTEGKPSSVHVQGTQQESNAAPNEEQEDNTGDKQTKSREGDMEEGDEKAIAPSPLANSHDDEEPVQNSDEEQTMHVPLGTSQSHQDTNSHVDSTAATRPDHEDERQKTEASQEPLMAALATTNEGEETATSAKKDSEHPSKRNRSDSDSAANQPQQLHHTSEQKLQETEMPPNIHPPEEKILGVISEQVPTTPNKEEQTSLNSDDDDFMRLPAPRSPVSTSREYQSSIMMRPASVIMAQNSAPSDQAFSAHQMQRFSYTMPRTNGHQPLPIPPAIYTPIVPGGGSGGRRKVILRLEEDADDEKKSFFFRRRSSRSFLSSSLRQLDGEPGIKRGTITVSWFEGTSSTELQEHVRKSVIRKMNLSGSVRLADMRIIDESMSPPEEIVLSPYIPDGSEFLLRFSTKKESQPPAPAPSSLSHMAQGNSVGHSAPVSPSAAPSPYPSSAELHKLNDQLLQARLGKLKAPSLTDEGSKVTIPQVKKPLEALSVKDNEGNRKAKEEGEIKEVQEEEVMGYNQEDQFAHRLRQLADLLNEDRRAVVGRRRREKRQVVFVLANYFVLFLSIIAIMAEIQARLPDWVASMEKQLGKVEKCAKDQDALFECVSQGDFAGLLAALALTLSRSATTKRILLFGFHTPKRLWTVVYESMVTAICWGTSYMFIRRGMNPDTRKNFLRKYWKDAVYGSLAGFNASFLKAVLKNLLPQEALEDALQDRQLKILSWLPSFN